VRIAPVFDENHTSRLNITLKANHRYKYIVVVSEAHRSIEDRSNTSLRTFGLLVNLAKDDPFQQLA
jgi:hypothetical protein